MIHHVHVPKTILTCALLVLVATVFPVRAADDGGSFTSLSGSDPGLQAAAAPATITPAAPIPTTNGLLQFTSQAEFEVAFPGLPKENFEESPVAGTTILVFSEPLNSSTNIPGTFSPGDILDGLTIQTVEGVHPSDALLVAGSGWRANTSDVVGPNWAADTLDIRFSGNVHAVGMDLLLANAPGTATITIYGQGATILETLNNQSIQTTATFFGFYSPQPITRITFNAGVQYELVDNIQFGAIPSNLTFYTSQAAFTSAHPGLPVEDFEESPIADDIYLFIPEPLDSSSNIPGGFAPGDILPGLSLGTVAQPGGNSQAIVGANTVLYGNQTVMIAPRLASSNLAVSFTGNGAYAVGMDLMVGSLAADTLIIVYGPHGAIIGSKMQTIQNTETFFGVYSQQPITKIAVMNNARFEFVDNIRFGGSPAGLTFYNSQASFLTAKPGLPVEDFEESPVPPGGVKGCIQPINSATNEAGCFSPGDILPGITFYSLAPCSVDCRMAVLGDGFAGSPTTTVGPDFFVENLEMTFAKKNVRYFGTDARVTAGGPADMLFSVYDDHDNFIGSALRNIGATPVYFGVVSSKHISRITITNPGGVAEFVDNVRFGAFPWQTIIPAISGH